MVKKKNEKVCEAFNNYGESDPDCEWLIDELPFKAYHGVRAKYIFLLIIG